MGSGLPAVFNGVYATQAAATLATSAVPTQHRQNWFSAIASAIRQILLFAHPTCLGFSHRLRHLIIHLWLYHDVLGWFCVHRLLAMVLYPCHDVCTDDAGCEQCLLGTDVPVFETTLIATWLTAAAAMKHAACKIAYDECHAFDTSFRRLPLTAPFTHTD